MSSTYLSLRYHIVFSTKDRVPLIDLALIAHPGFLAIIAQVPH